MTEDQARRTANVILGLAAAGAAFYVLKTPPLRRAAWRLTSTLVTGPVAAWLMSELQRAWEESGKRPRPGPSSPQDMIGG
jgi:hypothetical protein